MGDVSETEVLVRSASALGSHARECQGSCKDRGRSRTRDTSGRGKENRTARANEDVEAAGWNWREEYGDLISF